MKKYCVLGLKNCAVDFLYFERYKKDASALAVAALATRYFKKTAFAVLERCENGNYKTIRIINGKYGSFKWFYKIDFISENHYRVYID